MKMTKKLCGVLLFLLVLVGTNIVMHADAAEKKELLGSIQINLKDERLKKESSKIEFAYVKVAELEHGEYKTVSQFERANVNWSALNTAEQLTEAAADLQKICGEEDGASFCKEDGTIVFEQLDPGVYLLFLKSKQKALHVSPTIVSVPEWNADLHEMSYHVNVFPKYVFHEAPVKTGDMEMAFLYEIMLFGAAIVAILMWAKQYKCRKID